MSTDTLLATSVILFCTLVAYYSGYRLGTRHGKAAQWVDSYFDGLRMERARRDRRGRFAKKGGQP